MDKIELAKRNTWHQHLRKIAWSRTPRYLTLLVILLWLVVWTAFMFLSIHIGKEMGVVPPVTRPVFSIPMSPDMQILLYMGVSVGVTFALVMPLFVMTERRISTVFERELKQAFVEANEPYPYGDYPHHY